MAQQGLTASREHEMDIFHKGIKIGNRRVDFFVEGKVMVEIKAVIQLEDVHLVSIRPVPLQLNCKGNGLLDLRHRPSTIWKPTGWRSACFSILAVAAYNSNM